jgi:hypothetical protein
MVLDTDNAGDFASSSANNFKLFRNTISHEHGHGMGFQHVCPNNSAIIMEPVVPSSTAAPDMLSEDDIAHIHRKYGDQNEAGGANDTPATATDLGSLGDGTVTVEDVSIDAVGDVDVYQFTISEAKEVTLTLRPVGTSYSIADQPGSDANCTGVSPANFDLASRINLDVQIIDSNGSTVIATANSAAAGTNEVLNSINLSTADTYYARVFTTDADTTGTVANQDAQIQLYELDLTIGEGAPPEPIPGVPVGAPAAGLLGLFGLGIAIGGAGIAILRKRR